ncbi:MAG: ABC transporter ATP-binding protein [Lachnospiraceae bacterium]|nr:ABC transporter ATP-binding protein [Lachnospiraceae bacterium]
MNPVLEVKNLSVIYKTDMETVYAVNDISFSLEKGKTLGLVGETGAGKTTTALSILGLLPERTGQITSGRIVFEDAVLNELSRRELERIRGHRISMIFQDPMTALNPVLTVGDQIAEALELHNEEHLNKWAIEKKVEETLEMVGIPKERKNEYPHQFSGGMRQRVVIAIALVCNPGLLIADEPTTALDVTIQAQILTMICDLQRKYGTSVIMITHDLGVVAETCDQVAIVYAGEIVEYGSLLDIFGGGSHHPYTEGLFGSIPSLTGHAKRLQPIEGLLPDPTDLPAGCKFSPRCKYCTQLCRQKQPPIREQNGHQIRCHYTPDSRTITADAGTARKEDLE